MKPCYEGLKEMSWCWWDMKESVRFWSKYRLLPPFWSSCEMKPCYEGLKEIGVDVNEIWRKMLGFRVSIGLLPLILIIMQNKALLWRFERNWSWCWWDIKENVSFYNKYSVVTPYFDHLVKWNPVMKVWKKSELMLMRYEGKCSILEQV